MVSVLTQDERLIALQALLQEHGKVTLGDICQRFMISRDSARRDLIKLTALPGNQRIRGGAMLAVVHPLGLSYQQRQQTQSQRQLLARRAAQEVQENDFIAFDASTTLSMMVPWLPTSVSVVTNAVDALCEVAPTTHIELLGGRYNAFQHAILGPQAVEQLRKYRFNKAFVGVCALSRHGLSTADVEEQALKQVLIEQAERVILVTNAVKFDQQHFYQVASWAQIDTVICDQAPPGEIADAIKRHDIELIVCSESTTSV